MDEEANRHYFKELGQQMKLHWTLVKTACPVVKPIISLTRVVLFCMSDILHDHKTCITYTA